MSEQASKQASNRTWRARCLLLVFGALHSGAACGSEAEPASARVEALGDRGPATPSSRLIVETAIREFDAERSGARHAEDRWALRLRRYEEAEARVRRHGLDDGDTMTSLRELRRAFMGTEEARTDHDAAMVLRRSRGEGPRMTAEDVDNARAVAELARLEGVMTARRDEARLAGAEADLRSPRPPEEPYEQTTLTDLSAVLETGTWSALGEPVTDSLLHEPEARFEDGAP